MNSGIGSSVKWGAMVLDFEASSSLGRKKGEQCLQAREFCVLSIKSQAGSARKLEKWAQPKPKERDKRRN